MFDSIDARAFFHGAGHPDPRQRHDLAPELNEEIYPRLIAKDAVLVRDEENMLGKRPARRADGRYLAEVEALMRRLHQPAFEYVTLSGEISSPRRVVSSRLIALRVLRRVEVGDDV